MKKILLLIIVLLSFSLVSCNSENDVGGNNGGQQTPNKDPNDNTEPPKTNTPEVKEEFMTLVHSEGRSASVEIGNWIREYIQEHRYSN
jgi:hypothetical protein